MRSHIHTDTGICTDIAADVDLCYPPICTDLYTEMNCCRPHLPFIVPSPHSCPAVRSLTAVACMAAWPTAHLSRFMRWAVWLKVCMAFLHVASNAQRSFMLSLQTWVQMASNGRDPSSFSSKQRLWGFISHKESSPKSACGACSEAMCERRTHACAVCCQEPATSSDRTMDWVLVAQAIDLICCIIWHGSMLALMGIPSALINIAFSPRARKAAVEADGEATSSQGGKKHRQCCFYEGIVFHARHAPVKNSFRCGAGATFPLIHFVYLYFQRMPS